MIPVFHIGPFTFYTFGLVFGAAICLAWPIFERYFQLHGLAPRLNQSVLALIVISSGFVGAKTDYALINRHANVTFLHALTDLTSGYTYLGCILAGCLSAAIYARFRGIPILELYDSLFCLAPSYALGRIGCFLAGDGDYGISTTLPWGVSFPHGIVPTTQHVHPTMLYICLWETIVFLILWRISKPNRKLRPGVLLALYLIATSTGRFAIEFLSLNHKRAFGLTEAQLVSIALATTGLLLLIVMRVRQDRLRQGTRRDLLAEHYGVIDHVENDGRRQAAASLEQQAVGSA